LPWPRREQPSSLAARLLKLDAVELALNPNREHTLSLLNHIDLIRPAFHEKREQATHDGGKIDLVGRLIELDCRGRSHRGHHHPMGPSPKVSEITHKKSLGFRVSGFELTI
jgi:hypothetical protein